MNDKRPLSSFDLPTARAVASAWRRAYLGNRDGLPFSAASGAAERAYSALHPKATRLEVSRETAAIMTAVDLEHGEWLRRGLAPRPRDPRHDHDAYQRSKGE